MLHKQPNAFQCTADEITRDSNNYHKARQILVYMAQAGVAASKRHLSMLEEVERDGDVLSTLTYPAARTGNEAMSTSGIELGFDDWAGLTILPDSNLDSFDPFNLI